MKIRSLGLLAVFALTTLFVNAQPIAPSLTSVSNGSNLDTVTNTGVKTQISHFVADGKQSVTLSFLTANISGTQGGTVIPVASNDGVNFFSCGVVYGSSSVTVSASTLGGVFNPPVGYQYYGLQWTGTGTMQGTITSKIWTRSVFK